MKNISHFLLIFCITLLACDDDDIRVFDKTADERAAEAIASLKADLVSPSNGWRVKYQPVDGSGSFYVLMKFTEDNKVNIKSDLAADNRSYVNQTIGYRIDNSLGIELILENYSFFHYLYEQDQATFGAEYEFEFVNKTPDDALVFVSKSDFSDKTTILFEKAAPSDQNLLGVTVSENLETLSKDLELFSSSIKIEFSARDLVLYGGFDVLKRTLTISAAAPKSNLQNIQFLDYSSGYIVQGSSIVFDSPIAGNFSGANLSISSLNLATLSTAEVNVCADPTTLHLYAGQTSAGDAVTLESTIVNAGGASFAQSTVYFSPLENIRNNGQFVVDEIQTDLEGAVQMSLLYGLPFEGETLYAIGFALVNKNGSVTFALKEFTPVLESNKLTFNFKPGIRLLRDQNPEANLDNLMKYIDPLVAGNTTYVYKYADGIYEFNNPCTGWTVAFIASE
jgi:hypothetical protein